MQSPPSLPHPRTASVSSAPTAKLTYALLACGVIAGPLYILVGVIEMLIRPGFDLRRHSLSLLSNGEGGWIHIAMLITTGLLTIAGALGMRRVLHGERGGTWGPVLIGLYGLGLIGAGVFVADPALGFPPGTPTDATTISWHGIMHFVAGGIGFLGLIAACFVFGRRFIAHNQLGWAVYSIATGVLFFAAFFGIAAGSQQGGETLTVVNLAFSVAVVLGWAWVSTMAARLMREINA
jgi:hypothetical membrane protein